MVESSAPQIVNTFGKGQLHKASGSDPHHSTSLMSDYSPRTRANKVDVIAMSPDSMSADWSVWKLFEMGNRHN